MELPLEFKENMQTLLGEQYSDYIASMDEERLYGLRVNTSKISVDDFENISPFEIKKIPYIPNGFYYNGDDIQPAKHPYYFAGLYYLQDPSAMTPASRLPVEPGLKVLDLCAAPGGKSTELAARLCGSGVLVANDISAKRAKALQKNIELFGIKNSVITTEYPQKLASKYNGYFDRILVDAPCSGEGMFRKDPAMVKSWSPDSPAQYAELQRDIVSHAYDMLAEGGFLLYSTCTFSPIEDEKTVEYILDFPGMTLIEPEWYEGFMSGLPEAINSDNENLKKCIRIFPHRMDGEGHFLALFKKNTSHISENVSENSGNHRKKKRTDSQNNKPSKEEFNLWDNFANSLTGNIKDEISSGKVESYSGNLYYIPDDLPDMSGLKFIRRGLYLGECKKNRFEPSQALAMALKTSEYNNIIDLDSEDNSVLKYLKGETINCTDPLSASDGWVLICVDGFPLGWGKKSGTFIKNKYHSGWRMM